MSTMSGMYTAAGDRASRVVLGGSLALNLFLLGVGAAFIVRHSVLGEPEPERLPLVDRLVAAVPPTDGEKLRAAFAQRDAAMDTARKQLGEAQEGVRNALRSEPYDAGAVRAAMAKEREARLALGTILQDVVAAAADAMSADGRSRLAAWPSGIRRPPPGP